MSQQLTEKYNQPIPRYTSYPTVPFWKQADDLLPWGAQLKKSINLGKAKDGISLYLHLPFCESLCTYCGCNKRITTNHTVEKVYMEALLKEWEMYVEVFGEETQIRELHLGGGTPTFFSPGHLDELMQGILMKAGKHPEFEGSFEGHPNNTTREHLRVLRRHGFNRVSFGVQDLDERVQKAIHRIQPLSHLERVTNEAREEGYQSVNFDLIYGLPFQTVESVRNTFQEVLRLQPDRIAFYSYAHVPWTSKSQRSYDENDLPSGQEKLNLYLLGQSMLLDAGYEDIGTDHFSRQGEALLEARNNGRLHRNFMGYTTSDAEILIGLGVSAISDAFFAYRQNEKTLEAYYERLKDGQLPVFRGIDLSEDDIIRRKHILDITCQQGTILPDEGNQIMTEEWHTYLNQLLSDELVEVTVNVLKVTETGRPFLRNIAALFDATFSGRSVVQNMFSKAV
jgi:oxygen-independent coproporphyrinogen-3 oxidase